MHEVVKYGYYNTLVVGSYTFFYFTYSIILKVIETVNSPYTLFSLFKLLFIHISIFFGINVAFFMVYLFVGIFFLMKQDSLLPL